MPEDNGYGLEALYVKAENIISQHGKSVRDNEVAEPGNKTGKPCQKAEKAPFCVVSNECCPRRKQA